MSQCDSFTVMLQNVRIQRDRDGERQSSIMSIRLFLLFVSFCYYNKCSSYSGRPTNAEINCVCHRNCVCVCVCLTMSNRKEERTNNFSFSIHSLCWLIWERNDSLETYVYEQTNRFCHISVCLFMSWLWRYTWRFSGNRNKRKRERVLAFVWQGTCYILKIDIHIALVQISVRALYIIYDHPSIWLCNMSCNQL